MVSFTNFGYQFQDHWACIVYIHGRPQSEVKGYYLFQGSQTGDHCGLVPYIYPIAGALYVTKTMKIHMMDIHRTYVYDACEVVGYNTPETVYDNYCKDIRAYEYYGHNYDTYMTNIIDAIIREENPDFDNYVASQSDGGFCNTQSIQIHNRASPSGSNLIHIANDDIHHCSDNGIVADFNYPDKRIGYLNQAPTDFSFIGPDRDPIEIDSVDKLLQTADTILSTGVPNYQMARIPIKSDLNVEAWEHYLCDYVDKRLLQYIEFSYPLSIKNPHELCNKEVTACQYPKQVK